MIRSLGSSLLAKASAGSLSRKKEEARIVKPEIPGKGAVGTAGRDLTEQTQIQPVAPGSEKVIRSAPGIESASLPGVAGVAPKDVPLVAGMGLSPAAAAASGGASVSQGGGAASQAGQAGRQAATGVSTGSTTGNISAARAAGATSAPTAGNVSSSYEAQRLPFGSVGSTLPDIGIFGGRVSANEPNPSAQPSSNTWQPTTSQYVSGAIGKAINSIGNALGNIFPEANVSERLQNYGGSQSVAAAGKGSVTKAAQNVSGALRSVVQSVQNAISNLRSKLKLW